MSNSLDFLYDSEIFIDLYGQLGLDMNCKQEDIKTAYIKLAKKNHPDQGGSSELFQNITRAYEVLKNKEQRKEYDLYYLKKSMDDYKGDDLIRLKEEHKSYMNSNHKQLSKEELDKLYSEIFDEEKEKYVDTRLEQNELKNRFNDISLERDNMTIENDDTISNLMINNDVHVSELFEYMKNKNNINEDKRIMKQEIGTLDTLPGYGFGYASFNDNEYISSNLYTDIGNMDNLLITENIKNIDVDDFKKWQGNKKDDKKLSSSELDLYLEKRRLEEEKLLEEVEYGLQDKNRKKEIKTFLKTTQTFDEINRIMEEASEIKYIKPKNTVNENFEGLEEDLDEDDRRKLEENHKLERHKESNFEDRITQPKRSNVRKREFK
jgi:curved DNA-binding protein CbpA